MSQSSSTRFLLLINTFFLLCACSQLSLASTRRRSHSKGLPPMVREHSQRVEKLIKCSVPRPQVIQQSTQLNHSIPPATVLYRCGSKSGCCRSEHEECLPTEKGTVKVKLYFWVGPHKGRKEVVEKWMTNHTECECREPSPRRRKRMERILKRKEKRKSGDLNRTGQQTAVATSTGSKALIFGELIVPEWKIQT